MTTEPNPNPALDPGPDPDEWLVNRTPVIGRPKSLFESLIGRRLPDALFSIVPWGHRLVVLREPPIEQIGRIAIPDAHQRPQNRGYVVSIGDRVGLSRPGEHGCPYPDPRHLIAQRVFFNNYAGTFLALPDEEDPDFEAVKDRYRLRGMPKGGDFLSPYLILEEREVLGEWPGDAPRGVEPKEGTES